MVDERPNAPTRRRVFLSYSWDSDEHKQWVLSLASRLRRDGIDALLDQTHLQLGGRTPEFMERSVRESTHVLVICTETYRERFDGRRGGAGYEGHIISAEILNAAGVRKFIPVLRQGDWSTALPTALAGVYGIDLRSDFESGYTNLLRHLHDVERIIPLGQPPAWLQNSRTGSPMDIAQAREHRPIIWNIPLPVSSFYDRPYLIDSIADSLDEGGNVALTALHGLAGIGKTQLAG